MRSPLPATLPVRRRSARQRQGQHRAQAPPGRDLQPHLATIELRELAHDRQPEPRARRALVGAYAAREPRSLWTCFTDGENAMSLEGFM